LFFPIASSLQFIHLNSYKLSLTTITILENGSDITSTFVKNITLGLKKQVICSTAPRKTLPKIPVHGDQGPGAGDSAMIRSNRDLEVWRKAMDLAIENVLNKTTEIGRMLSGLRKSIEGKTKS
jgi:hypothetical protein